MTLTAVCGTTKDANRRSVISAAAGRKVGASDR
jgi:hypothetical protein